MMKLFKFVVRSKLKHCILAWRPYLKRDISLNALEHVQKTILDFKNYRPIVDIKIKNCQIWA